MPYDTIDGLISLKKPIIVLFLKWAFYIVGNLETFKLKHERKLE